MDKASKMNLLRSVVRRAYKYKGLNWIKTIYLNFRVLDFKDAIRLPIFVYGKLKMPRLRGQIIINGPLYRGMIKLGFNCDYYSMSNGPAMLFLSNNAKIIFNGPFQVSSCFSFFIQGTLSFGEFGFIGHGVRVRCIERIHIGKLLRLAVDSQIFDSNFHYMRNVETGVIAPIVSPIHIGNCCWIGNRSTIMKGTYLPDYTTVAGNSLVNKNFAESPLYPLIAGAPAKVISSGYVRLYSTSKQTVIDEYFINNPEAKFYQGETGIFDESDGVRPNYY